MKKLIKLTLLISLPIILNACNKDDVEANLTKYREIDEAAIERLNADQNLGLIKDQSGVFYKKTNENPNGRIINEVYVVGVIFTLKTFDGVEVLKATAEDSAIINLYTSQAFEGFFSSMLLLKEGEKGIFYIPSTLAFQDQPIAPLSSWQPVILEMEIPRIYNETEQINEYYRKANISPDTTLRSGLRGNFIVQVPNATPVNGNKFISLRYVGSFMTGSVFDSGRLDLEIGRGQVIAGFEEAVLLLKEGERGVFTFPSSAGYGEQGQGNAIPPHAPLKFEIEILDIL